MDYKVFFFFSLLFYYIIYLFILQKQEINNKINEIYQSIIELDDIE